MTKKIADKNVSFVEEEGEKYYAPSKKTLLVPKTNFEWILHLP